jgi:multidrug efflux pump subunit AcrA (membrane-fusion protein)
MKRSATSIDHATCSPRTSSRRQRTTTALSRLEKAKAAITGYQASIGVAEANYRAAQVGVEQTLIRAPFEGVVLTKNANVATSSRRSHPRLAPRPR